MSSSKLLIFAGALLCALVAVACTPTKPTPETEYYAYDVVSVEIQGGNRATAFAEALGVPDEARGMTAFTDSERFMRLPSRVLGTERDEEDGFETTLEALDLEALEAMPKVDKQAAGARFEEALKAVELDPAAGRTVANLGNLRILGREGELIADRPISWRASFERQIDGIPLVGPGANISATFDSTGAVTRHRFIERQLRRGQRVELLPREAALDRCIERYRQSLPSAKATEFGLESRLVYYAPPLELPQVRNILPHYVCGGTVMIDDREIALMDEMIPAVESLELVPRVRLEATMEGDRVVAKVDVEGGLAPYTINWSPGAPREDASASRLEFTVDETRGEGEGLVVVAQVTDANGITVVEQQWLVMAPLTLCFYNPCQPAAYFQYGTENAVTNQFGDLEKGFFDRMWSHHGADPKKCFQWRGSCAWEQDFKAPKDSEWADNADIVFYVGHGGGDGFTFEDAAHQDSKLDYNDADGDWGNRDLEWLALYSCQVLKDMWQGMDCVERWEDEFDGLHLLLGFETNARVSSYFAGKFATNLLDDQMTVPLAWFDAIADHQPADRVGVVMGVLRHDWVHNFHDHYWGMGSVGPDIPASQIAAVYRITGP